jgi:hypothetical protein
MGPHQPTGTVHAHHPTGLVSISRDAAVFQPRIQVSAYGDDCAARLPGRTAHRQAEFCFPALYGANSALKIRSDFLPGIEQVFRTLTAGGAHSAFYSVPGRQSRVAAGQENCTPAWIRDRGQGKSATPGDTHATSLPFRVHKRSLLPRQEPVKALYDKTPNTVPYATFGPVSRGGAPEALPCAPGC